MRKAHSNHVIRPLSIFCVTLLSIVLTFVIWTRLVEAPAVLARYSEMLSVISRDSGSARAFLAPVNKLAPATNGSEISALNRLSAFVIPLAGDSEVSVWLGRAWICPAPGEPKNLWFRGGHEIELIKVNGDWRFTGRIRVD